MNYKGNNTTRGELPELMDDEDWAIIFDRYGNIKGLFIPDCASENDEDVPTAIIDILEGAGIDVDEDEPSVIH